MLAGAERSPPQALKRRLAPPGSPAGVRHDTSMARRPASLQPTELPGGALEAQLTVSQHLP